MSWNAYNAHIAEFPLEQRMEVFDSFPKELREAYKYANEDYSIYQSWWAMQNGYKAQQIIDAIRRAQ